jgi:predicted RNA binding protein YcfA (HicA-like mRNA interferase family)
VPKITPIDWRTLERVFEADGFRFHRQNGSHRVYVKVGCKRPIIIPVYDEVGVDIIMNNLRTAGMSRERYFQLLQQ